MKKRAALLASVAALGLGGVAPASAQAYERVAQEETADEEDGGTDYGWIGLLGLLGLAGLLRRGPRRDDRVVVHDQTGGSVR